ncbi:hypothetical protein NDU88_001235 [Pleurodeles waltl]|uniref:Uncharacterized protein n=1 Tax=Pleurodeles waltl TaxID=8319 RepID=A0AAV7U6B3_PLEWA|nr:hypothetical protein NDU88_001235 [Pleurodeles waltl]
MRGDTTEGEERAQPKERLTKQALPPSDTGAQVMAEGPLERHGGKQRGEGSRPRSGTRLACGAYCGSRDGDGAAPEEGRDAANDRGRPAPVKRHPDMDLGLRWPGKR